MRSVILLICQHSVVLTGSFTKHTIQRVKKEIPNQKQKTCSIKEICYTQKIFLNASFSVGFKQTE